MTTQNTTTRDIANRPYVASDDDWGYCHVLAETVWNLSDLLLELARETNAHDFNGEHGFHRQATLLAYAAELKADAAAHLDGDDGAQCHARLAEIADDEAYMQQNQAELKAATAQSQSPLHA